MNDRLMMPAGMAIGAGLMYLLDPERGRRRRARMRDQVNSSWHRTNHLLAEARRDASNRRQGLMAELRAMITNGPVPDQILSQRVRSKLGRYSSHPRALDITADNGKIVVSGPILKSEVDRVLGAIRATRGVKDVEPSLEIHETADNVPALQGGATRPGERPDFLQENWAPATRVAGAISGGALAIYGVRRRGPIGYGLAASGIALAARGITNYEFNRLIGRAPERAPESEGVDVRKTINIHAPVEDVFKLWSNPENYPRFMEHVREVRKTGDDKYRWVVDGPGGTPVEWDAIVTEYEPNKKISWETVPGAAVPQSGFTRLDRNSDGSTRLDVQMSYTPPGGLIGHAVASIFGSDPKQQMDDDLVRFQTLIETGKTTVKGREVSRDELVDAVSPNGDADQPTSPADSP